MVKAAETFGFGKKGTRRNTHTDRMNTTGGEAPDFESARQSRLIAVQRGCFCTPAAETFGFGKKGTRRNTHTDRMNTTGAGSGKFQPKRLLNWGNPGDELEDAAIALSPSDPNYDSCGEGLPTRALL
eukprot:CAMPEP_0169481662 /NCGR_PEP_ID=MMETSP1042-20121227/30240_1 /TAXON_ID=464988 /ORGANISM="Hemiselmis andersenii, Strain CCMP1180" /LENGTH=126 /DNA_ID=CAMNT_0009596435 /DNA_START=73 /DNA_END=454 /DNA_ORIENTATION=+